MFEQYEVNGLFDEMFTARDRPRTHYQSVVRRLQKLNPAALDRRRRMADVSFRNQGITFTVYNDPRGVEKTFPFDLVPRIIPADEWETIERGLSQRRSEERRVGKKYAARRTQKENTKHE